MCQNDYKHFGHFGLNLKVREIVCDIIGIKEDIFLLLKLVV